MSLAFRLVLLALIGLQAMRVVRVMGHEVAYIRGMQAYAGGHPEAALAEFERARARGGRSVLTWEWSAESAVRAYDAGEAELNDADAHALLRRAWQGYAGAVLRSPAQSWSWSGLADVALRDAARRERTGLDLAELRRRGQGVLDPRRAVALSAAKLAVRLKPSGFQELDSLAAVYDSIGDVEAAQKALTASARMMPAPSLHVWGQGERMRGPLYRAVLASLMEGMAQAPSFERSLLHREIGQFAQTQGDDARAVEQLLLAEKTARYPLERHMAASALARALESQGRGNEAVAAWQRALALGFAPGNDAQLLGSLELRLGRPVDACAHLREALRHDPARPGLREHAAAACEQAGEVQMSEGILRDGLQDPAAADRVAPAILDLYWRTGRRGAALQVAADWQKNNPELTTVGAWVDAHRVEAPADGSQGP